MVRKNVFIPEKAILLGAYRKIKNSNQKIRYYVKEFNGHFDDYDKILEHFTNVSKLMKNHDPTSQLQLTFTYENGRRKSGKIFTAGEKANIHNPYLLYEGQEQMDASFGNIEKIEFTYTIKQ